MLVVINLTICLVLGLAALILPLLLKKRKHSWKMRCRRFKNLSGLNIGALWSQISHEVNGHLQNYSITLTLTAAFKGFIIMVFTRTFLYVLKNCANVRLMFLLFGFPVITQDQGPPFDTSSGIIFRFITLCFWSGEGSGTKTTWLGLRTL